MKKLSWIVVILAFVLAAVLIADVKKKDDTAPQNAYENLSEEELAKLFEQSRSEAELCYLSSFGVDDYDSYAFAFQDVVVNTLAEKSGVDYDTFNQNVMASLGENNEISKALYGENFEVGYKLNSNEKLEGAAFDEFKSTLAEYGVDVSLVKEAVKGYYSYILFNYDDKKVNEDGTPEYYFGEVPENAELLYSSSFELVLYYIDNGEDGGWFVSPEYF